MKLKSGLATSLPDKRRILDFESAPKPPERRPYSVYLIQYVPNLADDTAITIGLLLHDPRHRSLLCYVVDNFESVKSLHPQADLELLGELQSDFEQQIQIHQADPKGFLRTVKGYSNLIQISEPLVCWLRDPKSELQEMLAEYTEKVLNITLRQAA